jgi:hypothetical protein
LQELAERTDTICRLAAAMTIAPNTIAARDHKDARTELMLTARAIDEAQQNAGLARTPSVDLSGRLRRIAITLDRVLFMGGMNTTGGRPVSELRQALVAHITPALPR